MIGRCQNFEEVNMSTLPVKLLAQNTQFQGHVLLASFVWNAPTQKGQQKLVQLKLRFNLQVCVQSRWPLPNFSGEKFESGRVFFFSDGSGGAVAPSILSGWYSILYIYFYIPPLNYLMFIHICFTSFHHFSIRHVCYLKAPRHDRHK